MEKKFEKYLLKVIDKYSKILLLDKHTFSVKRGVSDERTFMECRFRYPYLDAQINYSERAFEDWKDKVNIKPQIVHELCHIITDPFYSKANARYVSIDEILDERELLTDHISNIIVKNNI